jgi:hypothetical protein
LVVRKIAVWDQSGFKTFICVLMILGLLIWGFSLLGLLFLASQDTITLPGWFLALYTIGGIVGIVTVVGIAKMKKWGILLYTATFVLNIVTSLIVGANLSITSIGLPLIIIGIGFAYFNQMD